MISFDFQALGTNWGILVDHPNFSDFHKNEIIQMVAAFEDRFSRFKEKSEVSLINQSDSESHTISEDLHRLLAFGQKLTELTGGHFDLNIESLMVGLGYDADYSFQKKPQLLTKQRGSFTLSKNQLHRQGPVSIDLGSLGKGFLIDAVADKLKNLHYSFFLIDGGGDLFVTSKSDHSPWSIALEHPLKKDEAIGQLKLINKAVATSSSNKRRFADSHHLVDPTTTTPVDTVLSVTTLSSNALIADACSTAIFVSPKQYWSNLANNLDFQYLAVYPDLSFAVSPDFPDFSL